MSSVRLVLVTASAVLKRIVLLPEDLTFLVYMASSERKGAADAEKSVSLLSLSFARTGIKLEYLNHVKAFEMFQRIVKDPRPCQKRERIYEKKY